jgi:hypothetical protein
VKKDLLKESAVFILGDPEEDTEVKFKYNWEEKINE